MRTPFIVSLLLSASFAPAISTAQTQTRSDPPVRLTLSSNGDYRPGDRASVRLKIREDGYLVVLRTDVDGWVRVLYPADPADDNFVRGGEEYVVRDHGKEETFMVSRRDGSGVVLAAFSSRPFEFRQFVRGDHWDYRALDSLRSEGDHEAALVEIAQAMAGGGDFDYDVTTYSVSADASYGVRYASQHDYYPSSYYPSYYYPSYYYSPYYRGYGYSPWCYGCYGRGGYYWGSRYGYPRYGYGYGYGSRYAYGYGARSYGSFYAGNNTA